MHQFLAIIVASLVAVVLGRLLFKFIFEDWDDLWDCVAKIFTPDFLSLFRGEFLEDMKQSLKLSIFLFAVVGSSWVAYDYVEGLGGEEQAGVEDPETLIESHGE
ncbi:hypothetical protein V2O64_14145 [Verrucomicrobiaceae bacterium 227]